MGKKCEYIGKWSFCDESGEIVYYSYYPVGHKKNLRDFKFELSVKNGYSTAMLVKKFTLKVKD